MNQLVAISGLLVAYALVSGRLRGTALTPAILLVGAGLLLGADVLDVVHLGPESVDVRLLAEATLSVVLFADATALQVTGFEREAGLPARLLGIGLPLTILAGGGVALGLFPAFGVFDAMVLAVLLAPTDAALGQTVVTDRRLPSRLRNALSVESGLNDGICVPVLFAAVALAQLDEAPDFDGGILVDLAKEVGIATGVGVAVAVVVAVLTMRSQRRDWLDEAWEQIIPLATAAIAYVVADELGGSGFIATFVAGLAYRQTLGEHVAHRSTRLMEEIGGLLSAVTFFVFGAVLVGPALRDIAVSDVIYAVLSLTVIRMVPVALALVRSEAAPPTMAFIGWFGPRGLATIVFVLMVIEESDLAAQDRIARVAVLTVLLSVVAHGVTAPWLTERYVRWLATQPESAERTAPVGLGRRGSWHAVARSDD